VDFPPSGWKPATLLAAVKRFISVQALSAQSESWKRNFNCHPLGSPGDLDYDLLIEKFGTKRIDGRVLFRLASYGPLHPMAPSRIIYSQRDMEWLLNLYDIKGQQSSCYRKGAVGSHPIWGPDALDLHEVPAGHLSRAALFQMTAMRSSFQDDLSRKTRCANTYDNALDVIGPSFDPKITKSSSDRSASRRFTHWHSRSRRR